MDPTPQTALAQDVQPGQALSISRYFTTPGIHPFDTVEWERRDARIGHGERVAFEQTDVEFPASWSQNATNIVSQKYFRGKLGDPARESSVKQMIGRVAGTIATWGRERGYFASDQDGDAFEAELTHILLHQMAAFNSPVWFNVGFEESPQCSACQPYHALVSTPRGMVPIGELVEEDRIGHDVYDANGVTHVVATKANGRKRVLRARLRNGSFVEATPDHVVKAVTERRTSPQWLPMEQLRVGMRMHLHPHGAAVRQPALVGGADSPLTELAELEVPIATDPIEIDVVAIEDLGEMEVYDIQTESGEYLSNNVAVHNCFILSVKDTMESILEWNTKEGMIFRGGSGSGINLSNIRGSMEHLAKGGTASGPVSFMRGADSWAGTIKSGGKTRRAAKMVVLDVDHPDIREFIECKAKEEDKAAALRDAGFDMSIDGDGFKSIQYQNANNSVRVTDEFMRAVEEDGEWQLIARTTGEPVGEPLRARELMREIAEAAWRCADPGVQYDTTINQWHTSPNSGRINASNPCSEYMHVDDSACNLASLNLMRFRRADGTLDVESFEHTVDVMLLAQEIVVGPSSYPTEEIGVNARAFRQLGLGYANLGAYLMSNGMPYDSGEGRATAAAITALMTGRAYRESARVAAALGPYERYAENREAHNHVMEMHREAAYAIAPEACADSELLNAARRSWEEAVALGERHGYRNAQATVLAPTGCLVAGSLIPTSRGLVRLRSLGDVDGRQWQDLDVQVATDQGPRQATAFYINGMEHVVSVETARGYRIQGTPTHRIKVVDEHGNWVWRRLAEIDEGDRVPMMLGGMVGEPREVSLPPLGDLHWNADHETRAPRQMTPELAEFVGYFMGDGSLHAKGIRLCVTDGDDDVIERLGELGRLLFGLEAHQLPREGYTEMAFHSVALTIWWDACGFSKLSPYEGHSGKGWSPHIPDAILHSNDRGIYAAFVRGLFEADGNANNGYAYWTTTCEEFSRDVQTLLLTLGFVTTRDASDSREKLGGPCHRLRILNASSAARFAEQIGFMSTRKNAALQRADHPQAARYDHIPVSRALVDRLAPENDNLRKTLLTQLARSGSVSRRSATALLERGSESAHDEPHAAVELEQLLGYFYDTVTGTELLEEQPTFDLSVPDNVTYVADGFVSHNTISFLMDCDTTGVEPDFSLVKFKELVGGGQMTIVNRTVPLALQTLGYSEQQVGQIEAYLAEHGTIVGAPGLAAEHMPVFDVAVGERAISHMGHLKMMGAVQPFISGAISKCVTGDTLVASERGLVRIDSLQGDEQPDSFSDMELKIASLDGTRSTDAFYYGGERPVREVTLRSGHRVTGTPNHRLLTCGADGLQWRRLDELEPGEFVATQYGDDLWAAVPARFDDFLPSPTYGSQKTVALPAEMNSDLAFFLGVYAAEGHVSRSTWTVRISNADGAVIPLVMDIAERLFGFRPKLVRAPGKCPSIELSSKRLVEFLDYLDCGDRASNKRIPQAVLRSPREMVLRFLDGLCLDAYLTTSGMVKWAICLDSGQLLDDLQAILTNLGVVHSRITKQAPRYEKAFDEVYTAGREAQRLVGMLNLVESHKARRAEEIGSRDLSNNPWDVIPGISGRELYSRLPRGRSGRSGRGSGHSRAFSHLKDVRTQNVSRTSLERVATVEGVELPEWLGVVLERNLHFSPVVSVEDRGLREVYDVSVPVTHAFVANGIVNHNTVNLPQESTVEDIADAYTQAWHLGIKALAIYRDGSKTAQALRTDAQQGEDASAAAQGDIDAIVDAAVERALAEAGPRRKRMPRERQSITHKFSIGGHEGYITAGMYEDGTVGEIFLTDIGKEGSTLRGMMNSFATAISIALQYGVPLETLVRKFSYMRFEPEGITGNPEIPFAKSMPDYIMRWLASRFLDAEVQEDLGILTPEVRARKASQETLQSVSASDTAGPSAGEEDPDAKADEEPLSSAPTASVTHGGASVPASTAFTDSPPVVPARLQGLDLGPACSQCGGMMQRTGSCYTCSSCGNNTGCG